MPASSLLILILGLFAAAALGYLAAKTVPLKQQAESRAASDAAEATPLAPTPLVGAEAAPTTEVARALNPANPGSNSGLLERLRDAIEHIEQGVILCDDTGAELFRNQSALRYIEARDGLVLVEAAVEELMIKALGGRAVRREVELFGPPAQSFVVSAQPFTEGAGLWALAMVADKSLRHGTETDRV